MILLSFHNTDKEVLAKMNEALPRIMVGMTIAIDKVHGKLVQHIVNDKLNGQVLHIRSGKLAGSIRIIPAVVIGSHIEGYVEGAGGTAWYGKIHESGGVFAAHSRLGRSYMMHFPQRSFMASSLDDMSNWMVTQLQKSLDQIVEQVQRNS